MRKKNLFGNEYEILYDTVRDHDTYGHLRVSLEVDRQMTDRCVVYLNGRSIGIIVTEPARRQDVHYIPYRFADTGDHQIASAPEVVHTCLKLERPMPFTSLGQATAAVISDFV